MLEKSFTVLAILAMQVLVGLHRGESQSTNPAEGSLLIQAIFSGIYVVILFLLLVRWERFIRLAMRDKLLLLLVGLPLISVLWSTVPEVTLRHSVALVGTTLFGIYLVTRYSLSEQLWLLAWTLGIAALLSLFLALALPSYGIQSTLAGEGWRGIYTTKNELGRVMVLSALVFLLLASGSSSRYRWFAWISFGLSVGLLLLSNSAAALVIFLTLLVLLPLYRALGWPYALVPFAVSMTVLAGATTELLSGSTDALLNSLGKDVTLTGRTHIWTATLEMIWKHPWIGYGYGGFWLGWEGPSAHVGLAAFSYNPLAPFEVPVHSHNGFLELWVELGLLGVSVFALGFLRAFRRAVAWVQLANNSIEGLWPLVFLSFLALYTLTEVTILVQNSIIWIFYVSATLLLTFTDRTARLAQKRALAAQPKAYENK